MTRFYYIFVLLFGPKNALQVKIVYLDTILKGVDFLKRGNFWASWDQKTTNFENRDFAPEIVHLEWGILWKSPPHWGDAPMHPFLPQPNPKYPLMSDPGGATAEILRVWGIRRILKIEISLWGGGFSGEGRSRYAPPPCSSQWLTVPPLPLLLQRCPYPLRTSSST